MAFSKVACMTLVFAIGSFHPISGTLVVMIHAKIYPSSTMGLADPPEPWYHSNESIKQTVSGTLIVVIHSKIHPSSTMGLIPPNLGITRTNQTNGRLLPCQDNSVL
jgi:hypothetical protein